MARYNRRPSGKMSIDRKANTFDQGPLRLTVEVRRSGPCDYAEAPA